MGTLASLRLARRPARSRVLVTMRLAPDAAAALLPAGIRPRLVRGHALVAIGYTRRDGARWLGGGREELAYRVLLEDGGRALAVPRRGPRRFALEETPAGLSLTVRSGGEEELHLRAAAATALRGSVFASAREAEAFLEEDAALGLDGAHALEPLAVHELRAALLDRLDRRTAEVDAAFRVVTRRAEPALARARASAGLARSAPALPSV